MFYVETLSEEPKTYKVFKTKTIQDVAGNDVEVVDEESVLTGTVGTFQDMLVEAQSKLDQITEMLNKIKE